MVHGAADINMRDYDPRRFGSYAKKDWQVIKAHEDYKLRHEIPFPHFNRLAGRPIKPSPLYEILKEKGAVYEEVFGLERPRWFARNGVEQRDHYSFRRNEVFDMVGHECRAVREKVGIMDVTAFTKVEVSGPDAHAYLDRLTANKMPQKDGSITLTHMLNRRGRIELETTIVRMAADRYYLVCAAFFEQRLMDHLTHNQAGEDVSFKSLSEDWSALSLNGPKSRDVLAACTDADLSNAGFRWLSAQEITVAGHQVWAFRMSYAGELGWELHMPDAACVDVYNALWDAGEAHGIENYGSFAMNSLRMEKAFPGAGELTNEVTLPEANVSRFFKLDKEYLGVEATRASAAASEQPWICAYLEIDPDGIEDGHGGEAVMLGDQVVGSTASVAYGHSVGKILAFAYVKPHANVPGTELSVIVAGQPRSARVLGQAAYDPMSEKPRTDAA
jgi:dimethylglycine dehydrogenase